MSDYISKEEELRAEINRLKNELDAIKNEAMTCGCTSIRKKHYPTNRPDDFTLAIYDAHFYQRTSRQNQAGRWTPVKTSPDRDAVINAIPQIVSDLQGLYDKLTEEDNE